MKFGRTHAKSNFCSPTFYSHLVGRCFHFFSNCALDWQFLYSKQTLLRFGALFW